MRRLELVEFEIVDVDGSVLLSVPKLSLTVPGIVGVAGESGGGKSLLCAGLLGLLRPGTTVRGSCMWDGKEVVSNGRVMLRPGRDVCWIGSDPRSLLDPLQKCGRQLTEAYRTSHRGSTSGQARVAGLDMLNKLGIDDPERRMSNYPHEISGGMAQRMVIAASLLTTAPVMLLDDALVGLDATLEMQIADLLGDVIREQDRGMMFFSHDPLLVEFVAASDVHLLGQGELIAAAAKASAWNRYKDLTVLA